MSENIAMQNSNLGKFTFVVN